MSNLCNDVREGLSAKNKFLSSKYFYDDSGSKIFQEIMNMPEYYLTNAEHDILSQQAEGIIKALDFQEPFSIIELGAGDGAKTIELLTYCVNQGMPITYTPVDISEEVTHNLASRLRQELPDLVVRPLVGDYFHVLEEIEKEKTPHLFLFLGSNIGNYSSEAAIDLMNLFSGHMHANDKILIGFDLMKNPHVISAAYDDPAGITKRFNMNLLRRINRELEADFDINRFDFYSTYNPENGEVKSFIISLEDQAVHINKMSETFHFERNELVYTELSQKFNFETIEDLGIKTGLQTIRHFTDPQKFFSDTLFIK